MRELSSFLDESGEERGREKRKEKVEEREMKKGNAD